jgi:hypothetical protein
LIVGCFHSFVATVCVFSLHILSSECLMLEASVLVVLCVGASVLMLVCFGAKCTSSNSVFIISGSIPAALPARVSTLISRCNCTRLC